MDVIATAMVSSLGYDVQTACAAARAGLTRAGELPFTVIENDRSPGLAIGHAASLLSSGFEGDSRLIRLLSGALRDLARQVPTPALSADIAFYLALPGADREHEGSNLILDDDARVQYLERIGAQTQIDELTRGMRILDAAMRLAEWPGPIAPTVSALRLSTAGHAAVIELYQRAQDDLDAGDIGLAVVGGVDSLLCPLTLTWLQLTGRLKSAASPAGLSPGEAAALVAVGGPSVTRHVTAPPLAKLTHICVRSSASQFLSGAPADGRASAQVLQSLMSAFKDPSSTWWVLVDQNGEIFRACDWGCSLVHLRGKGAGSETGPDVWYPAASFGDTGAAAGAVATCLAVAAHDRRYAPLPHAFVLTSSDGPHRAGCVVSA